MMAVRVMELWKNVPIFLVNTHDVETLFDVAFRILRL